MKLKEIERSATVAWSPSGRHPGLLALGTVAGAIDDSFMATAQLEIVSLDLAKREPEMPVLGNISTNYRFHRLAWGTKGIETGTYPYGLLGGGMVDGSVNIWNPAAIIGQVEGDALIAHEEKHSGPVRGLEFNPYQPNLLASGAADSEIFIWDVSNPSTPSVYTPGTKSSPASEISCVAWNRKVQHILASTSYSGVSVVWDLKLKRPVISFCDPNQRNRCSAVAWNPDVATQIIVATDDDRAPLLQVWDLRNAYSPLKELMGHTKGILSVSWCPNDSNLLLTCGKDNRTLCWNPATGEIMCELPASLNWNFDVQWSCRIPAILSTSSFDGKVSIYALQDAGPASPRTDGMHQDFSLGRAAAGGGLRQGPMRPPKWLQRPVGATFGFGGKLIRYIPGRSVMLLDGSSRQSSLVAIHNVVTERELLERSHSLEAACADVATISSYCQAKADAALQPHDKETWSLMNILFEKDARRHLLAHLGYSTDLSQDLHHLLTAPPEEVADAAAAAPLVPAPPLAASPPPASATKSPLPSKASEAPAEAQVAAATAPGVLSGSTSPAPMGEGLVGRVDEATKAVDALTLDDKEHPKPWLHQPPAVDFPSAPDPSWPMSPDEAFFANMASGTLPPSLPQSLLSPTAMPTVASVESSVAGVPRVLPSFAAVACAPPSSASDAVIKKALIVGNFDVAVDCCLRFGRLADALLLAACGGPQLWNRTQDAYLAHNNHAFMPIVSAVIRNHLRDIVDRTPLSSWKEALALLSTYARSDAFPQLCDALGRRLEELGRDTQSATLCYMCAGNVDKTVSVWASHVDHIPSTSNDALQDMIEKVCLFRKAAPHTPALMPSVADKFRQYADILASQGRLAAAMHYLCMGNEDPARDTLAVAILRDRLYHSSPSFQRTTAEPVFPFQRIDVYGAAPEHAQYASQHQQQQQQPMQATQHLPAAPVSQYSSGGQVQQPAPQLAQQQHMYSSPFFQPQAPPGPGYAAPGPAASVYSMPPSAAPPAPIPAPGPSMPHYQQQQPSYAAPPAAPPSAFQPPSVSVPPTGQAPPPPLSSRGGGPGAPPPVGVGLPGVAAYTSYQPAQPALPAASQPPVPQPPAPAPIQQQQYGMGAPPSSMGGGPPSSTSGRGVGAPPVGMSSPPAMQQPPAVHSMPPAPVAAAPPAQFTPHAAPATAPAAAPPSAAPVAIPANVTMQTADTSNVAPDMASVVAVLTTMYQRCSSNATQPAARKKLDDVSKRVGQLFGKLNARDVSPTVASKLQQLCQALERADYKAATDIQVQLTTTDWDEHGYWILGIKRLIETCKS